MGKMEGKGRRISGEVLFEGEFQNGLREGNGE